MRNKERKKETFELGWRWEYWLTRIEKARHLIRCNLYRKSFDYLGFSLDEGSVSADGFSFNPSSSPTLNNFTFFSPSPALPLLALFLLSFMKKKAWRWTVIINPIRTCPARAVNNATLHTIEQILNGSVNDQRRSNHHHCTVEHRLGQL